MNDNIFSPIFDITPRTQICLDDIERDRWLVEDKLLMPKHEAWIRRDISLARASATTRIEGASLDETAVRELLLKNPLGKLNADEQANLNALRAYEFVDFLSDQPGIPIDELVIRQINRELLRGASEILTPGVYRKGQNTVGNFSPPDQGDVPGLMQAFAKWLQANDAINPILRAGMAHIHLVAIHPFWDGNGRTARALATLILQRSLFHFKKLLSLERGMFFSRDAYFTAIERTLGGRFAPIYDATSWLEFFTLTLSVEAGMLRSKLTDFQRAVHQVYKEAEERGLNHRQEDGLLYAMQTGKITRADYMEITKASPITASRDLAGLLQKGLLNAEGKTRTRVYYFRPHEAQADQANAERQLPLLPSTGAE